MTISEVQGHDFLVNVLQNDTNNHLSTTSKFYRNRSFLKTYIYFCGHVNYYKIIVFEFMLYVSVKSRRFPSDNH